MSKIMDADGREQAKKLIDRAEGKLQRDEDARVAFEKETARLSAEQKRDAAQRAADPLGAAQRDRDRKHTRGKGDTK